ncbi:hypothetical protein ACOSQ2_020251 [Xanthoceras sorbifolium]
MEGNKTNNGAAEDHHHQNYKTEDHHQSYKTEETILQKTLEELVKVLSCTAKEDTNKKKINACIDVHQKALDDLVNVNSLFTIAVFVGLAYANPKQRSLENRPDCDPDPGLATTLIIFEVNSFACFLLSSLVAKSVKVLLNIRKKELTRNHRFVPDRLCKKVLLSEPWKRFSLGLSVMASFAGIVLLTLSMINLIQIRVGKLNCGSDNALRAVVPLCAIVFAALLFYIPSMAYAVIVIASACLDKNHEETIIASNGSTVPEVSANIV